MNSKFHLCLKAIIILSMALFMSNSSCQKQNKAGVKQSRFDVPFEAGINKKTVLISKSDNLLIEITNISDNRCPVKVNCIQAGNATVTLSVYNQDKNNIEITLCTGACKTGNKLLSDSATVSLSGKNYTFILKAVNPYPAADGTTLPKKAEMLVKAN